MDPTIDLAEAPRERGRAHGAAAKRRVARSIAAHAGLLASGGIEWSAVMATARQ